MVLNIVEFKGEVTHVSDYSDEEGPQVRVLRMKIPGDAGFSFKPGQFVMIALECCTSAPTS